jgi:hypothetical protein
MEASVLKLSARAAPPTMRPSAVRAQAGIGEKFIWLFLCWARDAA